MFSINDTVELPLDAQARLRALGVAAVYFYGSRLDGTASEHSDYDVGVVFGVDGQEKTTDSTTFTKLYHILSEVFPDTLHGPRLDLALLESANAALQMSAISKGRCIFEGNPVARADFEEAVVKRYDDYRFLKREYEEATLAAFRPRLLA